MSSHQIVCDSCKRDFDQDARAPRIWSELLVFPGKTSVGMVKHFCQPGCIRSWMIDHMGGDLALHIIDHPIDNALLYAEYVHLVGTEECTGCGAQQPVVIIFKIRTALGPTFSDFDRTITTNFCSLTCAESWSKEFRWLIVFRKKDLLRSRTLRYRQATG